MTDRTADLDRALDLVQDGAVLATGGSTLTRKPMTAVRALAERGIRDLELVTFTGSLDVEELVAAGALRAVRSSHVSIGAHGPAPRFTRAVEHGELDDLEESEWMLLGRLRAAAAGMPFLPTRAARGSDLVAARGLREVTDPYTGESLLAVPALRPDVALLHAWRADRHGNVQLPWPPEHLWDVDILVARAARHVVVTVERIVEKGIVRASAQDTVLHGLEVTVVVEAPGGAAPTASPPEHREDTEALASAARGMIAMSGEADDRRRR